MSIVAIPDGRGRWIMEQERSMVISLKMKESDLKMLDRIALELGCSRSSLMRLMLRIGYIELERLIGRLDELERITLGQLIDKVDSMKQADAIISYLRIGHSLDESVKVIRGLTYGEAEK